ncbi:MULTISPECIES: DEAD/DEAH box helicase family protein [Enterococcus]|uniref:DEAD/DEAH box helicase family protein n=1 Tax=Enterococcus TaxID=1350 RepID=UPI00088DB5E0|nr:DEAD/DEAH box helicase family protein [Enterococcus casseliflavus]SDK67068.1 type III restriction enzyme [Enterococcus casseliflavus]
MPREKLFEWLSGNKNKKNQVTDGMLNNIFYSKKEIPSYIQSNLSDILRPYQKRALESLEFMLNEENASVITSSGYQNKQLLFNMATGSGKTMVMASIILYMYQEFEYQNFLFFVNTDAIVSKTKENLLNPKSSKYLFSRDGIVINGNSIEIEQVRDFPINPSENTIYLKLTTIQGLHEELNNPRENAITYNSLKQNKVIMLGDEAHHFNADTKKKKLSKDEVKALSWEKTIENILYLRNDRGQFVNNKLFEFTATLDMGNPTIKEKYLDKIIFSYDLKQFMQDKYSKNVVRLQATETDDIKMMDALLMSQYRKLIAKDNGIYLKPIVMFKSNTIKVSNNKESEFKALVENLSKNNLLEHIKRRLLSVSGNSILYTMYSYYLEKENKEINQLIVEIKEDFHYLNILNANGKELLSVSNATLLNTLEEPNNPVRVIFAVAKLNEGWDVLNLYDIVRVGEGAASTKSATDSEAQLIGRGARYYPFIYQNDKSYRRRFDKQTNSLAILETLHYHTTNESAYLKNLEQSLDAINLDSDIDGTQKVLEAKLKTSFVKNEVFKFGKLYENETTETTAEDYSSLSAYGIDGIWEIDYISRVAEKNLLNNQTDQLLSNRISYLMPLDKTIVRKAMQRNKFFHFNRLKEYAPILTGKVDFLEDENFLGNRNIRVFLPSHMSPNELTRKDMLVITEKYLLYIESKMRRNYKKVHGLRTFKPVPIRERIKDYAILTTEKDLFHNEVSQRIVDKSTTNFKWYVYDKAVMNHLEYDLLVLIDSLYSTIQEKYPTVFLIRNDDRSTRLTIREFDSVRGFMPDFVLYLQNEEHILQVYIEPKGKHLVQTDLWKQNLLEEIQIGEGISIIGEDENVKLSGVKFFNHSQRDEFIEDLSNVINDGNSLEKKL